MRKMSWLSLGCVLAIGAFIGWAMCDQSANAVEIRQDEVFEIASVPKEETEKVVIEVVHKTPKAIETDRSTVQKAWDDIPLSEAEQIALWDKCHELDINYWFVLALLESESNYRFVSGDSGNSVGYMQINKCNWERMKNQYGLDAQDKIENLLCGATIFWELANKYDTIEQVVMSYKCGETRAKQLMEQGVILACVESITNRSIELENAHR